MKKSVFEMVVALVNGREVADMDTLRQEVNAEWDALMEKSKAKVAPYEAAKPIVMNYLRQATEPQTTAEIFAALESQLPDDFTENKLRYAFRVTWANAIVKHENGKNPLSYSLK